MNKVLSVHVFVTGTEVLCYFLTLCVNFPLEIVWLCLFLLFNISKYFILLNSNFKMGVALQLQEKITQSVYQHHKSNGFHCNDSSRKMHTLWKSATKIHFPLYKDCKIMHSVCFYMRICLGSLTLLLHISQNFTVLGLQVYSHVYFLYLHQFSTEQLTEVENF